MVRARWRRCIPVDTVPGGIAGGSEAKDPGRPENTGRIQRCDGAARVSADGVRVADDSRHNVGNDCQWHGGQAIGGRTGGPCDRPIGPGPVRIAADLRRRPPKRGVTAVQVGGWQLDAGRELAGHAV